MEADDALAAFFPGRVSITLAQRHRFAATMSLAADDAGLPADPEFRAWKRAATRAGTRGRPGDR